MQAAQQHLHGRTLMQDLHGEIQLPPGETNLQNNHLDGIQVDLRIMAQYLPTQSTQFPLLIGR